VAVVPAAAGWRTVVRRLAMSGRRVVGRMVRWATVIIVVVFNRLRQVIIVVLSEEGWGDQVCIAFKVGEVLRLDTRGGDRFRVIRRREGKLLRGRRVEDHEAARQDRGKGEEGDNLHDSGGIKSLVCLACRHCHRAQLNFNSIGILLLAT